MRAAAAVSRLCCQSRSKLNPAMPVVSALLNALCPSTRAPSVSNPKYATARVAVVMGCRDPKNAELTSFITLAVIATSRPMIRAASATDAVGCCRHANISWNAFGALGNISTRPTRCASRSLLSSCLSMWVWEMAAFSAALSQGLARYWWATPTVRMIEAGSAWPDRTKRTILGSSFLTRLSNCHPSIPGMRMSETITSAGVFASSSRAAAPLDANTMLHSFLIPCRLRCIACRTCTSSSANTMRIIGNPSRARSRRNLQRAGDGRIDRQSNEKCSAYAALSLKVQRASMLVDDHAVCNCEPLPCAPADFLGREEWVEDLGSRRFGDAGAGIADRDFDLVAVEPRTHREFAESAGVFDDIRYRVRRIHQQVEDHLIDLAQRS